MRVARGLRPTWSGLYPSPNPRVSISTQGLCDVLQPRHGAGRALSKGNPCNGPGRGAAAGLANAPLISAFM